MFILFAFICYALVAFGLAMNLKSNLTHAASEGARSGIGILSQLQARAAGCTISDPACQEDVETAVIEEVKEAVDGQSTPIQDEVAFQLENPTVTEQNVDVSLCDGSVTAYCLTVTIPFNYRDYPIVPSAPGLGVFMPDQLLSDATVRLTN